VRAWRAKRKLSQLALGLRAGVSTRHLSFVESGRSMPSAELILRLCDSLQVPLRERNQLLLAAGLAPQFPEAVLSSPDFEAAHRAIEQLVFAHDPYPGVAVDRYWNIALANKAAQRMIASLPEHLRQPPVNLFRAGLHPEGFAAITTNFDEWGAYLLGEIERLAGSALDRTADALLEEVRAYPNVRALVERGARQFTREQRMLVSCELEIGGTRLSLFTALVTFGSPRDVTLAELTGELFYPVDEATAAAFRAMA
jgi:transcriptional regulator with XRE-family HTH domain